MTKYIAEQRTGSVLVDKIVIKHGDHEQASMAQWLIITYEPGG